MRFVESAGVAMIRNPINFLALAALAPTGLEAATLRVFPSDSLVLNPTYESRGYFDLMVPTVAIATGPREKFHLAGGRFELLKGGRTILSRDFQPAVFASKTKDLASSPAQFFVDAQFVGGGGMQAAFGQQAKLASSVNMGANQILVLTEEYLALDDSPDSLRVTVRGVVNGRSTALAQTLPVRRYAPAIRYHMPVAGNWLRASNPILNSHHRFIAPSEFAVDLFKVDGDGMAYHDNSAAAENWYAYGRPVMAAADGEVVKVISDVVLDRTFLQKRPGESEAQRSARAGRTMQMLAAGPNARLPDSVSGNLIVIRHGNGTAVEYSSYGHLKAGSVRVKPGDQVKQGQTIAEVGDTGDTPVAHLHFQVNAGPDPFGSKSLPFDFVDTRPAGATRDPGYFIRPAQ